MHWERWICQGRVLERCVEENTWRWCGWFDDVRWGLIFAGGPLEFRETAAGVGEIPSGATVLHCQVDTQVKDGRYACAREARRAHSVEELAPWPHDGWLLQAGGLGGPALLSLRPGASGGVNTDSPREAGRKVRGRGVLLKRGSWLKNRPVPVC